MLSLAGDRRLVEQIRRGSEAAFEVVFERYHRPLLTFCRHMLGSREDAEDALQQTFASAYRAMQESDGPLELKPWLYTIARNRCLSMLRAPRPEPVEEIEGAATAGLSEEVERRAELRDLVRDLRRLPESQRAALVLFEVGGLSQAEIGEVLDVHAERVKALVFQARAGLMDWRHARETPCADVREALAAAKTGRPRQAALRRHLATCEGCADFAGRVKEQRALLAIALPAIPSVGLWESVAAAAGIGGGSAGGGLLAGGLSGLAGSGAMKIMATGALVGGLAGGGALVVGDAGEPRAGESDAPAGAVLGVDSSGAAGPSSGGSHGAPAADDGRAREADRRAAGRRGSRRAARRGARLRRRGTGVGSPGGPAGDRGSKPVRRDGARNVGGQNGGGRNGGPGGGGQKGGPGGGGHKGGTGGGQKGGQNGGGQNAIPPAAAPLPEAQEEGDEGAKKPKKPKKYKPKPRPPKQDHGRQGPKPDYGEENDEDGRGRGHHGKDEGDGHDGGDHRPEADDDRGHDGGRGHDD